jgi:phenylalanyl-tRNA synthetase beta chain
MVADNQIGSFGELKKEICGKYDIETPVFIFAFDYDALFSSHSPERKFSEFSRNPVVKRDLSVVFAEKITAQEIVNAIRESGGELLIDVQFFDLYRGKQIGQNLKSISVSLQFQAQDRTLRDEEVDTIIADIVSVLKKMGGEIRDR